MNNSRSLETRSLNELRSLARQEGLSGYSRMKKDELVQYLKQHLGRDNTSQVTGYLDINKDGRGLLCNARMVHSKHDVYVSNAQIKRFGLRTGDMVQGQVRKAKEKERYRSLVQITSVNGIHPEDGVDRPEFEQLMPVLADQQLALETRPYILGTRLIDMVSPIGKGQRGLIVGPPRTGRTTIVKQIANGLADNHPAIHTMVILVGERPEEVTDMRRSVKAEVVSTTFDESATRQTAVAELALQHALRLVELQRDVVILLDSLNSLTRAYAMSLPGLSRAISGGPDPEALQATKHYFGMARNLEEQGSLTIVATCLTDTGSAFDDAIYEEFKGTNNMELRLDQRLAERRIFPAIDIPRSRTRHEELLLNEDTLQRVWTLRRMVDALRITQPGIEPLLAVRERLRRTRTNSEFLNSLNHRES
ncbi:MAG: transcription termination factor Rho [Caldilineales bacterium]|nr:transcription termination factor Rho [Caldilineales bacterium]